MTANQINYAKHLEGVRHNIAEEAETNRANLAREVETNRSNRQFETIGFLNANAAQAQAAAALQNAASNARNAESNRIQATAAQRNADTNHFNAQVRNAEYMTTASQSWSRIAEEERHNRAMEAESNKSTWAKFTASVTNTLFK